MEFLAKLFGIVPASERDGIRLHDPLPWHVAPTTDRAAFLAALPDLLPQDSILYLEGTTELEVAAFLTQHGVPPASVPAVGTVWPAPDRHHLPLHGDAFQNLIEVVRPAAFLAVHVHAYHRGAILLEWHDAFDTDPMYISSSVPEESVRAFATALGVAYEQRAA